MNQSGNDGKEEIRVLLRQDAEYPERLRKIPGPPKELYVLGRVPSEQILTVALIGARDCSEYGRYVAAGLGAALGSRGIQVISGMARGIDGIGQEAALDAGGSSFGVLGCGVDICYPAGNRRIYEKLKLGGGLLSEYPPGAPPLPGHFPPRNRIVSGLADVVVVVEAREKSGTLITVDMALEQGREVYVVPGRMTDPLSAGCNKLLKLGAGLILSTEEFLDELLQIGGRQGLQAGNNKGGNPKSINQESGNPKSKNPKIGSRESGNPKNRKAENGNPDSGNGESAAAGAGGRKSAEAEAEGRTQIKDLPPEFLTRPELLARPELAAVYHALDFTPGSVDKITARLPAKYREEPVNIHLIRLCLENLAFQVSPGQFCLRGGESGR